jgi:hypothetical protein
VIDRRFGAVPSFSTLFNVPARANPRPSEVTAIKDNNTRALEKPEAERLARRQTLHTVYNFSLKKTLFPSLIYLASFSLLTYPLIKSFSTHYFTDEGDGLQNLWNLWWVKKSLLELHQLPWHTSYLHYPYGTSLLSHTLTPFNGLLFILLSPFFNTLHTHNLIILFSFVGTGLTTFWLAYYFVRSYWPSIIAGFIYTFSNYHFAHADGHLNLISLEWIPLFLLCWYVLVTRPSIASALASAFALFLVLLCDYYYFFYCVIAALIILVWKSIHDRDARLILKREYRTAFAVFLASALLTSFPLMVALFRLTWRDPLTGVYDPRSYSLDLLALLIPGGHWRFAELTSFYWQRLPGEIEESSVHLGLAMTVMLVFVCLKRRALNHAAVVMWSLILCVFFALALGPTLHIAGREISYTHYLMPYNLLEYILPVLSSAGRPVRMVSMITLAAALLGAWGFAYLFQRGARRLRIAAALLLLLMMIEFLPKPLPARENPFPQFVQFLKTLPSGVAVFDARSTKFHSLYYQTRHEKPIAFGYTSRTPLSVYQKDRELERALAEGAYKRLYHEYGFHYLVLPASPNQTLPEGVRLYQGAYPETPPRALIYEDGDVKIYDLRNEESQSTRAENTRP